jgi:hypothetical protein
MWTHGQPENPSRVLQQIRPTRQPGTRVNAEAFLLLSHTLHLPVANRIQDSHSARLLLLATETRPPDISIPRSVDWGPRTILAVNAENGRGERLEGRRGSASGAQQGKIPDNGTVDKKRRGPPAPRLHSKLQLRSRRANARRGRYSGRRPPDKVLFSRGNLFVFNKVFTPGF